ncbi:hypothetical protein pb186bvf_000423 [Paramecium bursaria]
MESQNIQVLIRVRPLNYKETHLGSYCCVESTETSVVLDGKKEFQFDKVLGTESDQVAVYQAIGDKIIRTALSGVNCCLFAYGQTGAGKTYTMQGNVNIPEEWGLQLRVFDNLFSQLSIESSWTIKCTFLEIYNEQLIDLLSQNQQQLNIREESKKVYVENLTEVPVQTLADTLATLIKGLANRHVSSTSMNLESSRSHSIFTMHIESKTAINNVYQLKKSKLNFVDLAGSERQKQTAATGDRLREAANINKSLTTLGLVINSLSEQNLKKFIPYRDSKLTFLLKESLGGNSRTFMIASVSSSSTSFQETLSTLKFAQRAKQIKNQAIVNEESGGTVETLKAEIKRLNQELQIVSQQKKVENEREFMSQILNLNYQLSESTLYREQLNNETIQMREYYESKITELESLNSKYKEFSHFGSIDKDNQLKNALDLQKEMRHKLDTQAIKLKELQTEETHYKHKKNEMEFQISQMQTEVNSLQQKLLDSENEQERLRQNITQLQIEIEQLQDDRTTSDELQRKIDELVTQTYQMQEYKDQMDTDQQYIEFQNQQIQKYKENQNELDQVIQKEKEMMDNMQKTIRMKQKRIFLLSNMTNCLKKLKRTCCTAQNQTVDLIFRIGQQFDLQKENYNYNNLDQLIDDIINLIQKLRQEIVNLNEEIDSCINKIQQQNEYLSQLENKIKQLEEYLEQNKADQEALRTYDQLKQEFVHQKEKLQEFFQSYDILSSKLIQKENEVSKLKSELRLEQTQRAKSLEEIDKLRETKVQLSNKNLDLEQQMTQLQLQMTQDKDNNPKKNCDNMNALVKANAKLVGDLNQVQRLLKNAQDEKDVMQKKYEEKMMYGYDHGKIRKEITITHQLKEQLDQQTKENQENQRQLQQINDFFKKLDLKRYANFELMIEGTVYERVIKYFQYLELCQKEFEQRQYQLTTNTHLLSIEKANCNLIKDENRMLKLQLQRAQEGENSAYQINKKVKM